MLLSNNKQSFGLIAILFHWLMAVLLIALVGLGLYMTRLPISLYKIKLYGWHKEWGMLALMLLVVRLTWRLRSTLPSLAMLSKWEELAARGVHWLFYLLMLALPMTGWLLSSASGLSVGFFGWFVFPNLISPGEQQQVWFAKIHIYLAYSLIVVFCLHVAAALKHYFINKDTIMRRMLWP